MGAATRIIYYIIPLLMLVLALWFYYGPEQGFDKLKRVVSGVEEYLPQLSVPKAEIKGEPTTIPADQSGAIANLQSAIQTMLTVTSKTPNGCFSNFGGFSSLGEYGTSILFKHEDRKTTMFVYGGTDGRKILSQTEFDNMVPCVIGGSEQIVSNFDNGFLNSKTVVEPYYNPVQEIVIAHDTDGLNENRINYGTGYKDFEGQAWLFTPDNKHICFFPTVDGNNICDGSQEEGLDDDCFIDTAEKTSIPYQISSKGLPLC